MNKHERKINLATAFELTVELPNGETGHYLAANDLEPAIMHRVQTRGSEWRNVWLDALFNVPVAPYLPKGDKQQPPIRTVRVIEVEKVELTPQLSKLMRTRSQFLPVDMWSKQSVADSFNFMHHDHSYWSQRQIEADIDFWKNKNRHPVINFITWLRIKQQRRRVRIAKHLSK